MKRALVTGGAGFIGANLCRKLLDAGFSVCVLDNLYTGRKANLPVGALASGQLDFIQLDVENFDSDAWAKAGKCDLVFNLACPASPVHYQADPVKTIETSYRGVISCLEFARSTGAILLHASTSEIYGDPLVHPQKEYDWGNVNPIGIRSCYDEGKRIAETLSAEYARKYDLDVRMVRIFNTYGPMMRADDGRVISNFIVQALKGEDLTVYGDGSQTRSFQFVDDLVRAFMAYVEVPKTELRSFFAAKKLGACVLNIGNPDEFTVLELAEKVIAKTSSKSKIALKPLPGDDPKRRRPDITLAKELLGYQPKISLSEGLDETISYFKNLIA